MICPPWSNGTQFADWEARNCSRCQLSDPDEPEKCPLNDVMLAALADLRPWTPEDDASIGFDRGTYPYTWDCPQRLLEGERFPGEAKDCEGQLKLEQAFRSEVTTCAEPGLWGEYVGWRVEELLADRAGSLEALCLGMGLSVVNKEDTESLLDLQRAEIVVDSRLSGAERDHAVALALGHAVLHSAELVAGVELGEVHAVEAEAFASELLGRLEPQKGNGNG